MGKEDELRLVQLARRQVGLVTAAQLEESGVARSVVERRRATGEWRRVHWAVFKLSAGPMSLVQRNVAALLAGGPSSVLSHGTAARLLRLEGASSPRVQLTVPYPRTVRGLEGVDIWRSRDLAPADARSWGPFRFTNLGRTVVDLASVLDDRWLRAVVDSALRQREANLNRISLALKEHGSGRPGASRLRALLAQYDSETEIPDSVFESISMELGLATGRKPHLHFDLPTPTRRLELDFAWPEAKLGVELDSWRFHCSREAFERDRRRDRQAHALGWVVLRFTWREVKHERQRVIDELAFAHRQRMEPSLNSAGSSLSA